MVQFDLILKYLAGKASPDEAMEVDDWAALSNANKAFLQNTHQAWLAAENETYRAADVQKEWEALQSKIQPTKIQELKPQKYVWLSRVAALLAIVATAYAGYYTFNRNNQNLPTLTAQASDKKLDFDLKDGSHIALEAQSALIYPVAFANDIREVTLAGSSSFDVTHNAAQPFVVNMGELHVKVLGTSFSIASSKKEVDVAVSKGLVAFYNRTDTVLIPAGSMAKYVRADNKFTVTNTTPLYGSFQFNQTALNEVAAQLSAYFKVDFQFSDAAIKNCKMNAGFEHKTLKEIVSAISATFNLEYKMEGNKILLSGKACK